MTQTGRCLCGEVTYEIEGDVMAVAVCHCDHCQRQSGGAFSTNLVIQPDQFRVSGDLSVYEDRGRTGDAVYVLRKFCGTCGSPIVSELTGPGILAVKAGTLDDRSGVQPVVQVWHEERQPWVVMPEMATVEQE
ncbi:MAG: aldehyde-activating protein [Acidimicrobiaceae bacterium]|nr:aldehyde-activating protein [Acidimicrobiaceae bacterium]